MNLITLLLAVILLTVIFLLTLLFYKHNKLKKSFQNYNPNPVYGPGRYDYGLTDPVRLMKEMRLERIRYVLSFRWSWYWMTKQYRKERKIKKEFNKTFKASIKKRKKKKLSDKYLI